MEIELPLDAIPNEKAKEEKNDEKKSQGDVNENGKNCIESNEKFLSTDLNKPNENICVTNECTY